MLPAQLTTPVILGKLFQFFVSLIIYIKGLKYFVERIGLRAK